MVAHSSEVSSRRERSRQTCKGRACQAIYLDLGATTLQPGPEEAGQGWFFHTYDRQGIQFDRFLLWEAVPRAPEEVFRYDVAAVVGLTTSYCLPALLFCCCTSVTEYYCEAA